VAQVIEHLPSKLKALDSEREKEKGRERWFQREWEKKNGVWQIEKVLHFFLQKRTRKQHVLILVTQQCRRQREKLLGYCL
jgi:hypothetical protein